MIIGVIMAGGIGERIWPKSKTKMPKQFLKLYGDKTMIQQTVDRLKKIISIENIFIVTTYNYINIIYDQIPELPKKNIIIEPMNKNTAACICLSAFFINRYFDDSIMIVVPSDHIIKNEDKFIKILKSAIEKAKLEDNLILLGIKPFYPETGYGYIKINKSNKECINNNNVYKVEKFIDKPDYKTTVTYIQNEDYFWNSGIFIWKTSTILKAINKYMPDLYIDLNKINNYFNINKDELLYKEYSKFKSISIDKGVLEKASNIYAIIGDFGWDDLGSWTSLDMII